MGAEFLYTLKLLSGAWLLCLAPSHHNHAQGASYRHPSGYRSSGCDVRGEIGQVIRACGVRICRATLGDAGVDIARFTAAGSGLGGSHATLKKQGSGGIFCKGKKIKDTRVIRSRTARRNPATLRAVRGHVPVAVERRPRGGEEHRGTGGGRRAHRPGAATYLSATFLLRPPPTPNHRPNRSIPRHLPLIS